jgi:hypothetical protein
VKFKIENYTEKESSFRLSTNVNRNSVIAIQFDINFLFLVFRLRSGVNDGIGTFHSTNVKYKIYIHCNGSLSIDRIYQ